MSPVSIIPNFDEFLQKIDRLHSVIMEEKEKQQNEYNQLGIDPPSRISFESLDLHRYLKEMLRVHKTLQWRGHRDRLSITHNIRARVVAIAGICEMIKEEYVGRFWDLYERKIGWGGDSYVYDSVWERGFREAGIELIRGDRREFVQTLVMESGIPKSRTAEIISFFEIFWRYLKEKDVLQVIYDLNNGNERFTHIPSDERNRLISLSDSASEYSRAFALAVTRLLKVFEYIENSAEIITREIDDCSDQIFKETGVNPLTVLRDERQLRKLYSKLLGKVTPEKLRRILSTKPPGTEVLTPDGGIRRSDKYEDVQFGEHDIDGAVFTCIPSIDIDLGSVVKCPMDKVSKFADAFLLRSTKKITATINGVAKHDIVRKIWVNGKLFGNVFYYKPKPADLIHLHTADYSVNSLFAGNEGLVCYPYLHYSGKSGYKKHYLSARVNFIRFFCPSLRHKKIQFSCSHDETSLYIGMVDKNGRASCGERFLTLRDPYPGEISFYANDPDRGEIIDSDETSFESCLYLDDAMLFSPYTHRQIRARKTEKPYLFGSQTFILYLKSGDVSESLNIENLEIESESVSGTYRVLSLNWENQSQPCRIMAKGAENYIWIFRKCLNFKLYISPNKKDFPQYVTFNDSQRSRPSDFNLVLNPFPADDIVDHLFWNIIVNDSSPIKVPLKNFYPPNEEISLRLSGKVLEKMIRPAWTAESRQNAKIEISLCTADETLASRFFFVLPNVLVQMPDAVREGDEFRVKVNTGDLGIHDLLMKNQIGRSKIKIRLLKNINGAWQLRRSKFTARLELDKIGTHIDVEAIPPYRAVRFGNRENGRVEPAREILKRELSPNDLIIVSGVKSKPAIMVNNEKVGTVAKICDDGVWALPLASLPKIVNSENNVRVISKDLDYEFIIKFRLALLGMSVDSFAVNNTVSGKCSFRGPVGSKIELKVYGIAKDHESFPATSYCIKPEGREVLDHYFAFSLSDTPKSDSPPHTIEHYEMAAFLKDKDNEYEYGERWIIRDQSDLIEVNTKYAITKIGELLTENRPFVAKGIFDQIKKDKNTAEMKELEKEINQLIMQKSLKRIVGNVKHILRKEYLFDI